ncbi:DUF2059 domain-containing protein [Opitutus sp. ER46]|uniref:DUF2059 domain-containing protein n=1 Tax=Opitutus sp. ER46 TaxID=2161864 RepID=UPI000D317DF1|nr:DUF2059 domain-containing protein [Opitutus sp. ER46]PTX95636.1 hypothetical protein DB354_09480 [Opitutus sp. ER46]
MKTLLSLCLATLTAAAAWAAESVPVFNATLTVGKQSRFMLVDVDGKSSSWLKLGDAFAGFTLKEFDAKTTTLSLEKDGKVTPVTIASGSVAEGESAAAKFTPATIAEATAVLDAMHFEDVLDKTMAGARKQQVAMIDRMMSQMGLSDVDRADAVAMQKKIMDTMMAAVSGSELKADVAKAYSEIFSKEELQQLGNFYASPLGQAFSDKQPALAEKMNQIIMPRMMSAMPKVQAIAKEFAAEQMKKKAAAAAAANPTANAVPTPETN